MFLSPFDNIIDQEVYGHIFHYENNFSLFYLEEKFDLFSIIIKDDLIRKKLSNLQPDHQIYYSWYVIENNLLKMKHV